MLTRITLKRCMKRAAGWAAAMNHQCRRSGTPAGPCIFVYHRVARLPFIDNGCDDWNVSPDTFERQIAALAESATFAPLEAVRHSAKSDDERDRPVVCITFDDGYASVFLEALPILKRYQVPATIFIVTSLVGQVEPPPFDRWSQRNRERVPSDAWRPMNWDEVESCIASGLVRVGSHSHEHLNGGACTPAQLREETERSRDVLRSRLGNEHATMYAYPYGSSRVGAVTPAYVDAVRRAGYELAVTTDLGIVSPDHSPYLLPRIEAHGVDQPRVVRAKAAGVLGPYRITDRLRTGSRTA